MNLSPPAARRPRYKRTIECEGFQREDGLWDIEARVIDTKPFRVHEPFRGVREPGQHVHDMMVRVTIDKDMVVRNIETAMLDVPYVPCSNAQPAFKDLIGKKIGSGWRRAIQESAGGVKGCTHMRELLLPVATIAFQTLGDWPDASKPAPPPDPNAERPYFIDGCKAWAADGPVVARLYPHFQRKTG
jgi:hypothetical protein